MARIRFRPGLAAVVEISVQRIDAFRACRRRDTEDLFDHRSSEYGNDSTLMTLSTLIRSILVLVALSVVLALGACGGGPRQADPTTISITLRASKDVNAGGLPIVVRVYELKTVGGFESADFFSLYDDEQATLGSDLLAREQLDIRPDSARDLVRKADPSAQYLGVLAAFRDIDEARWKSVFPLEPNVNNVISVLIGANAIAVSTP